MSDVSILLLTYNGAASVPVLLEVIRQQDFDGAIEVVAVDSGSTDGTIPILRERADRLLTIDPKVFNHGATRNFGIAATKSALVVLIVQDAIPANDAWLRELIEPLRRDARVAAAWSRQCPAADASPLTRMHLQRWLGSSTEPRVVEIEDASTFQQLAPWRRFELCTLDNVSSCIRRTAWERRPFERVPIGEDVQWARDVLMDGWRIAYAAESVVRHSHERSVRYEFMRTLLIHHRLRTLFGLSTVPGVGSLARAIASSARAHAACLDAGEGGARPGEWGRALGLSIAWPLGQYVGARLADWRVRVQGFPGI